MYSVSLKRFNLPDLYLFLTMAGIIPLDCCALLYGLSYFQKGKSKRDAPAAEMGMGAAVRRRISAGGIFTEGQVGEAF